MAAGAIDWRGRRACGVGSADGVDRAAEHPRRGAGPPRAPGLTTMARLALWVRCAACGREFDTGIRMAARNFAKGTFAANYHTCPRCGARGTYRKGDYVTRDDAGAPPAASG